MSGYRFLLSDYMNRRVHYINEARPELNWSVDSGEQLQDLQRVDDARFVHTHDHGWSFRQLVDGRLLQTVHADIGGITTLRRFPDGQVIAGLNTPQGIEIRRFDATGNTLRSYAFPDYHDLRTLRPSGSENWLFAHHDGALEVRLDDRAEIIRHLSVPQVRYAYQAEMTPDGNYLLSGGYSLNTVKLSPDNRVLQTYAAPQPPGQTSYFYSGFQQLKNGCLLQANWNGHNESDYREGLKLFIFDPAGKTIWHWTAPREQIGAITTVIALNE